MAETENVEPGAGLRSQLMRGEVKGSCTDVLPVRGATHGSEPDRDRSGVPR